MENHNEEWPLSTCPQCGENVYLTTTHNVRNDKWTVLPINVEPTLNGDFVVDLAQYHSAVDILGNNQGDFPIAIYTPGNGEYRPHNPSHYLESGDQANLGLLNPQSENTTARASASLPGFEWLGHNSRSGSDYATNGPARIVCHMTVGMGLSRSYVVNHSVPPQLWVNPYTGDRWQTLPMNKAGYALYQPQFGSADAWTNRHGYTIQIEIVGVPVVNQVTYTDAQNRWIGEQVIAPIIQWFRDNGIPFDTKLVRQVTNSSGSANENWHGRMSERESVETGGTVQHIVEWANDHWDCSVERLDLWVQYALAKIGGGGEDDDMYSEDDRNRARRIHDWSEETLHKVRSIQQLCLWLLDDTKTKAGKDLPANLQIGKAADSIASLVRRTTRVRLISVEDQGGYWITDGMNITWVSTMEEIYS